MKKKKTECCILFSVKQNSKYMQSISLKSESISFRKQNGRKVAWSYMGICKSWTLDSGLDHGLDYGLDYGHHCNIVLALLPGSTLQLFFACVRESLGVEPGNNANFVRARK